MTKSDIKALIELKQQDMPFDVRKRSESLPIDGKSIIRIVPAWKFLIAGDCLSETGETFTLSES